MRLLSASADPGEKYPSRAQENKDRWALAGGWIASFPSGYKLSYIRNGRGHQVVIAALKAKDRILENYEVIVDNARRRTS
jgi:hypothetical protein